MKINWHQERGGFFSFLFIYLFIFSWICIVFLLPSKEIFAKGGKKKIITLGLMRHSFVYEQSVDVN